MKGARLLVLGAGGQLGSELVRVARGRPGWDATPLTRAEIDLSRPGAAAALGDRGDFDLLVNCAAYTRVDDAESDAATAFQVNARSVGDLAGACRRAGARFVTIGTDYVFDGRAGRPCSEDDPPAPLNVYGASKLMGEALAREAWSEGTWVVRTAALFGTVGPGRPGRNFVETMIGAARAGRPLRVVDDVVASPTWTGHLAPAILDLLAAGAPPGVYHLAGDGEASWHALAVAALEGIGLEPEVRPVPSAEYPAAARRPRYSVLDCGRAERFGVKLPAWREGLRGYLAARSAPAPAEAVQRGRG